MWKARPNRPCAPATCCRISTPMDRTELAWAAGFWDGEGSAYLTGSPERRTRQPQGRINQAGTAGVPAALVRFQHAVGFGLIKGPHRKEGREPLYRWIVSSRAEVRAIHDLLGPWLGPVKRLQLEEVLGSSSFSEILPREASGDELLAWAAGLFDGEGSTYNPRHRSHSGYVTLEAAITQSDPNGVPCVLSRFAGIVRNGRTRGPYPAPEGCNPVYRWKSHRAADIAAMVAMLRPWLGAVKRDQADSAIARFSAQAPLPRGNPAWGNRKTHCVRGHEYATARRRSFKGRGRNEHAPRASHQCLACLREHAARKRRERGQKERRPSGRRSVRSSS